MRLNLPTYERNFTFPPAQIKLIEDQKRKKMEAFNKEYENATK